MEIEKSNIAIIFKKTKKLLAKIAKKQGMPMHYNSIMICINQLLALDGSKVDYGLNDLDDDKIFDIFYNHTWKTLFYYPPEEPMSKTTFAAFIASLDSSLVETKESPPDFAEDLFLQYYDPRDDL